MAVHQTSRIFSLRPFLASLVLFTVLFSSGCSPANLLTLGGVLDHTLDQVNEAIKAAREAGRVLEFQAGNELAIAIANMKVAYADLLDKTLDKLDARVRQNVDKITESANRLERQTARDVKEIMEQTQQVVNTLPLSNKSPQVRSFSPTYFVNNASTKTTGIRVAGNFPQAADKDYHPSIVFGQKQIEPSEITTQHLSFELPTEDTPAAKDEVRYFALTLKIPYILSGWFTSKKEAEFPTQIGSLPGLPGTLTITSKHKKNYVERQHIVTQSWAQHSSNDDFKDVSYTSQSFSGWTVVEPSVRFVVEWSQGTENDQWSKSLKATDNGRVWYTVTTIHHGIGTSGKVNFHFEFDIVRNQTTDLYVTEAVLLNWGESRVFPYPLGTWKVRFVPFQGNTEEFIASSSTNPYLAVTVDGIWLKLKMASPSELLAVQPSSGSLPRGLPVNSMILIAPNRSPIPGVYRPRKPFDTVISPPFVRPGEEDFSELYK